MDSEPGIYGCEGCGGEDGDGLFVTKHATAIARLPASLQLLDSNATIDEKLPCHASFQTPSTEVLRKSACYPHCGLVT